MKSLLHFVRFREILPFHISFFPSWRIFRCKKVSFAKILVRRLSLNSVEFKKSELIHPFEVLVLHEFFSWGVMMEWLGGKRLKLF